MSDHKVKIVATSTEEFARIEEKLAELPEVIYNQIEEARNHVGLECLIKDIYGDKALYLPDNIVQQSMLSECINIYCGKRGDTEYRFVLSKRMSEKPIDFRTTPMPEKPKEAVEPKKVRIEYDQQPNEVADSFKAALSEVGITVTELDGGDGFNEYEIKEA